MRLALALTAAAMLCACASDGRQAGAPEDDASARHDTVPATSATDRYVEVLAGDRSNARSGIAPMPFGRSMFGPWDVEPRGMRSSIPAARSDRHVVAPAFEESSDDDMWFSRSSLHTVLHYVAMQTGLNLIMQGDIDSQVTAAVPASMSLERGIAGVRTFCEICGLDFEYDGDVVIIREFPEPTLVIRAPGLYSVEFNADKLLDAIRDVVAMTGARVLVPLRLMELRPQPQVSLQMNDGTPEAILARLAELSDMDLEYVTGEGVKPAYVFKYRK